MAGRIVDLRKPKPSPARRDEPRLLPKKRPVANVYHRAFILLLAFGTASYGAMWGVSALTYIPQLNISRFVVSGARTIPERAVDAYVDVTLNDGSMPLISPRNIFLFNPKVLEMKIAAFFPRARSVSVERSSMLATAISVNIEERTSFATWCSLEGTCYDVDESGYIFAPTIASSTHTTSYVFYGTLASTTSPIGQTFAGSHFASIAAYLRVLGQNGFVATKVQVDASDDFTVTFDSGMYVIIRYGSDPRTVALNMQLTLSDVIKAPASEVQYIDVRYPDRIRFMLRNTAPTSGVKASERIATSSAQVMMRSGTASTSATSTH